jgi:hypothetical protein
VNHSVTRDRNEVAEFFLNEMSRNPNCVFNPVLRIPLNNLDSFRLQSLIPISCEVREFSALLKKYASLSIGSSKKIR